MTAEAARTLSKDQQAKVARMKQNPRNFATPRTVQEAARTQVTTAKGSSAAIPLELHNQLAVQTDAQGNVHVIEMDGAQTTVPASGVASE